MTTTNAPTTVEPQTAMQRIAALEAKAKQQALFVAMLSTRLVEAMELIAGLSVNQRIFVAILDAQHSREDAVPGEDAVRPQKAH